MELVKKRTTDFDSE